jgi:hypothetical protein
LWSRRIAIAAVFSVIVFTSKAFAPAPFKDSFVIVQALLLGLAGLLVAPLGATLVSTIAGLMLAGWAPSLAVFSVGFSVLYGLMLDSLLIVLHPLDELGRLKAKRFTLAVSVSTAAIGIVAYAVTLTLRLLPRNPIAEVAILVAGGVTGVAGGYVGVLVWRRAGAYLRT